MPRIIACYKWVVDEAYIRTDSSPELDLEYADKKMSDYDRNAIEEAMQLYEKYGGSVAAITVGHPDDTKGVKDALSRGPEKAYFINDPSFENLEPAQTAVILADVITAKTEYDLIICGEGSSDLYAQQVGPRLAELLDIPCVTMVSKIDLAGEQLIAERKVDDGIETVSLSLPALLTVLPDINSPRIPGLRDTLAASKKPVIETAKDELSGNFAPCLQVLASFKANMERNGQKLSDEAADIALLLDTLQSKGIIARGVK